MFCCHYNKKDDDVVQLNVLENVHQEPNVRREEDIAVISIASIENGDEIDSISNVDISKKRNDENSSTKMHIDNITDSPKTKNSNPDKLNMDKDRMSTKSYPEVFELQRLSSHSKSDVWITDLDI